MTQRKPLGQDPWQSSPRTPGPLGINDAAAPSAGLPGPTPGPMGMNDHSPGSNLGISKGLMEADGSGGGSGSAGGCQEVEIEINNTSETLDDLVLLQYPISTMKTAIPCRMRAKSKKGGAFNVMLTNPDRRLRFSGGKEKLNISIPGGGGWAEFEITGAKGSDKLGDAMIEAHCDSDTGALIGKKAVTVVWFDDSTMDVIPENRYFNMADLTFTADPKAVTLRAKADIRPKGVNCRAPQIAGLRVGIIQNSLPLAGAKSRTRMVLYGPPEVIWLSSTPDGAKVQIPEQWQKSFESPVRSNDSVPKWDPLYQTPPGKDPHKPGGCDTEAGLKGTTESQDNPGTGIGGSIWVRISDGSGKGDAPDRELVKDEQGPVSAGKGKPLPPVPIIGGKGNTLGWAKYPFLKTTLQQSFLDWAVIFDNDNKQKFICLRQRGWSLNLDSNDKTTLQAKADSAEREAAELPVVTGKFSNDINDDPANWKTGPLGKMVSQVKDASSSTIDGSIPPPGIPK